MDSDPASPPTSRPPRAISDEAHAEGGFPLTVHAAWDETPSLRGILLAADPALVQQYTVPGQYLEVRHKSLGHGFFALAAAPADAGAAGARLELLVRRGSALADALAAPDAARPDGIYAAGVRGHGFPIFATVENPGAPVAADAAAAQRARASDPPPRDLLLVAAGSGIAPLRAVLQRVFAARARFGHVGLVYGQRHESDLAYRQELEEWRQAGLDLTLVLTRPPAGWHGGTGYVQEHLGSSPPAWLGGSTTALLCGMTAMISEVTRLLRDTHQLRAEQILLNY